MKKKIAIILSISALSTILFAQSAFAAYSINRSSWPTISSGSSGGFVRSIQADMWSYGYSGVVGTIDGSFGPATTNAVKAFQTDNGLTSDGSVGPATRTSLASYDFHSTPTTKYFRNPDSNTYETYYSLLPDGSGGQYLNFYLQYKWDGALVQNGNVF